MISSRSILTIVYCAYSFSNAQFLEPNDQASKWTTITYTNPGGTETFTPATETFTATTEVVQIEGFPGAPASSYTTTESASTITYSLASTETYPVETFTHLEAPEGIATILVPAILYDMQSVAPDVTSLPISVASKLNADWLSMWHSFTSDHPAPSIFSKVDSELASLATAVPSGLAIQESIYNNMIIYPDPTQTASIASALSSLLAPYPSLSSDIKEYITAAAVWEAPEYLAEISIIRSDLSITSPAPTWLSQVSAYLPSSTSGPGSSKNSATTTRGVSVLINAGIAAAGIIVIGLM